MPVVRKQTDRCICKRLYKGRAKETDEWMHQKDNQTDKYIKADNRSLTSLVEKRGVGLAQMVICFCFVSKFQMDTSLLPATLAMTHDESTG